MVYYLLFEGEIFMTEVELKNIRRELCHIKLIKQAKEILENRLNGEKNYVTNDVYNVFTISAFLLLKENLIKKDCNNDILYFDYADASYIPYILDLASKVEQSQYIRNNTMVNFQNAYSDIPRDLDDAIWILNKIRDSLAHGAYEIIGDKIIIDNDHTDEVIPYKLSCTLSMDDLAKFVLSVVTNTKIEKKDVFKYISSLLTSKENNEKYMMVFRGNYHHILKNLQMRKLPKKRRVYFSIKPTDNDYDIVLENEKYLRKQTNDRAFLWRSVKNGFVTASSLIEEAKDEEKLANQTLDIINSLTDYFDTQNKDNIIDYIFLYNYMELVFSLDSERNLDLSNFDVNIDDVDYTALKNKISDIVCEYTGKINDRMALYKELEDTVPFTVVHNAVNGFHGKVEKKVNSLNRIIVSKIRNGVDHANIKEEDGFIKISDKANQNSDDEKASFVGDTYSFFTLVSYIEERKLLDSEEIFDISLLKNIVEPEEYNSIVSSLENVNKESKNKVKCL